MSQNPKKLHHYVPRRYMKGFSDSTYPRKVWRYEKGDPEAKLLPIATCAAEKDYYSCTTEDGGKDSETIENMLEKVEEAAETGFSRIAKRQPIAGRERCDFALYLAFMLSRVPAFRSWYLESEADRLKWMGQMIASHEEGFHDTMDWIEQKTGL